MKRLTAVMAAHVDAGKTTLSEALLYASGALRKTGRVDKGDAFLDTEPLEKSRGITIYSKQAVFRHNDAEFTLLDTPGHADFAADAERAFAAADCAILVISGTDGVQSHTRTVWKLLEREQTPVFVFVNKIDIARGSKSEMIADMRVLSDKFVDFDKEDLDELLAERDETAMNEFLETGKVSDETIMKAVSRRSVFPVVFGAALKNIGAGRLLELLERYASPKYPYEGFAAQVYKISTGKDGARETFLKINGGSVRVRDTLNGEKISQIRIYSGAKYAAADEAHAGQVCAVTGLEKTFAGQCFGEQKPTLPPMIEPALSYSVTFALGVNIQEAFSKLKILEDEDPQLKFGIGSNGAIIAEIMGEIQLEVLKNVIEERFGLAVSFGEGKISYKETICEAAEGVGHYEPLRHYAEVHLLLEPLPEGSGVVFDIDHNGCRSLDENYRNLVISCLKAKRHVGVLTGSPITDIKITLKSGKAHIKHTEGGDFREAAWRAVRQGLAGAKTRLLEPFYEFRLEVPQTAVGRAMTDLQRMGAQMDMPQTTENMSVIEGVCPASEMRGYHSELIAYTRGEGRLFCAMKGYFPCHNEQEIIESVGYNFESDVENSADSVFCSHGAGVLVKWNEVPDKMHLPSVIQKPRGAVEEAENPHKKRAATDKELMEIFERTYGKIKAPERTAVRRDKFIEKSTAEKYKRPSSETGKEYLLVDGYNIIFAWDELKKTAADSLDAARVKLINIMCGYQAFKKCELILVFDAYRVKTPRELEEIGGITVVYTKEAETADTFIEKTAHDLSRNHRVRVATSDSLEQIIILGSGGMRVSAEIFKLEVDEVEREIKKTLDAINGAG